MVDAPPHLHTAHGDKDVEDDDLSLVGWVGPISMQSIGRSDVEDDDREVDAEHDSAALHSAALLPSKEGGDLHA